MWRLRIVGCSLAFVLLRFGELSADPPSINSVSPLAGIAEGGTLLTIRGRNLDRVTAVKIGGAPAENLTVRSAELIFANAPPGRPGPAEVVAESPHGVGIAPKKFLYQRCAPVQGSALRFDGTDDLVTFGAAPARVAHTVEAWVKLGGMGKPCCQTIVGQISGPDANASAGWSLAVGDYLSYALYRKSSAQPAVLPAAEAGLGLWVHIAGAFDGAAARLYLNGTLVREVPGVSFDPSTYITAGAEVLRAGTRGYFSGELDEVRIWSYARSAGELRDAMHHPLSGREPGLVAYWTFDEGRGQTAADSSPSGLHGTLGRTPAQESRDPAWVPSDAPIFERPSEPPADAFRLDFEGPAATGGNPGARIREGYFCTLAHTGLGQGAQGWSLSIAAEGAAIARIITGAEPSEEDRLASDGTQIETDTGRYLRDGFQFGEITSGGVDACEGLSGAVSAVVLSYVDPVTLRANSVSTVAWIEIEVEVPEEMRSFVLRYADGCQGSGVPVSNLVTQAGESCVP